MDLERDARERRERGDRGGWAARLYIMVAVTGVAFLLTACMMGPDYKRPETPSADSWRLTTSTAESIANMPWWELLKDQALQTLIRASLQENLDLQIATANIEEFQAQLMIAKFDLVPSLNYTGTAFGFRNTNDNVFPAGGAGVQTGGKGGGLSVSYESIDVGLKWEVDLWGRIRRSIEAARAQLKDLYEEVKDRLLTHNFDYFDFIHTLLPTSLPLEDFFAEMTGLYRRAIPPWKQLALLRRYAWRDIPPLLAKSRRAFARMRAAHRDYSEP